MVRRPDAIKFAGRSSAWPAWGAGILIAMAAGGCSEAPPPALPLLRPPELAAPALPPLEPDAGGPARVVSLVPSATEILFALGYGDRLVGRSRWCDAPPEARSRPALGGFQEFDVERILDLAPDLVVTFASERSFAARLHGQFGLPVLVLPTEEAGALASGITTLAEALGDRERGEELRKLVEDEVEGVAASVEGRPRPRVLVLLERDPLVVPGPDTFVARIVRLAGGDLVSGELTAGGPWPQIGLERVFDWDPDLILDLGIGEGGPAEEHRAAAFWARLPALRAVRTGGVHLVEGAVLVRPGPRMGAAARWLASILHP
jgi:iron complex transport system substrate-binding protein